MTHRRTPANRWLGALFLAMMLDGPSKQWYLVSSHGSVLFFIATHPGCTTSDIAQAHALSQRTVWGITGNLRRAGLLTVRKEGRHHHYEVDPSGPFLHPTISGIPLGLVLGRLQAHTREPVAAAR